MTRLVRLDGVDMTRAAAEFVAEVGVDVQDDLRGMREGGLTQGSLLRECLEGADPDREEGIRDYVAAVCQAVRS